VKYPKIKEFFADAWNTYCGGVQSFDGVGLDEFLTEHASVLLEELETVLEERGVRSQGLTNRTVYLLMGLYAEYMGGE
jgi:hypothetical protein